MIRLPRQRPIAWLAMFAMWLVCAMPVVSQMRAASAAQAMDGVCSAESMGAASGAPDELPQAMEKCGYCFLAAHSPALPGGAGVALPAPPPRAAGTFASHLAPASAKPSFTAAAPRGPPGASLQS